MRAALSITALRDQVRRIEGAKHPLDDAIVSTGCDELDRLFPEGGIRRGSLIEWHGAGRGHGAASLALIAARQACAAGGALVVVDRQRTFYPHAASALGIDLNRLMVVRPANHRDELWVYDQSLRCEAVAVVWGHVGQLNARSFRRLQLSAEAGNSVGLFVRPRQALNQPTWSDMRLLVEPQPATKHSPRFRVEVVRCHGGRAGCAGEFVIDETTGLIRTASDETCRVHLDSQLAHSTNSYGKTGSG